MNVINIDKQVSNAVRLLPDENYMLGRTLMQPFKPANSGSRALMNSVHVEHLMILSNGEIPLIQTGYETKFGECSTSHIVADDDYEVLYKIPKFSFNSNHYYLILRNMRTNEYDYVERVSYKHNTESYGYMWDNTYLDKLSEGNIIPKNSVIKTSKGYDEYGNKKNGVNLITLYLSSAQNMEDSVILSESAAAKLETNLIKSTSITINENDILLNLYGNDGSYKAFPDIGEAIKGGIFCAIRRVENKDILFSLSIQRQKDIMLSDKPILLSGYVADIDVYCNNPESLKNNIYNAQLYKYYQEKMAFCHSVNDIVGPIAMNNKLSYNLQKMYSICRDTIYGKEYFRDRQFNNVILKVTIIEPLKMEEGDKVCDRYGGKGVVSAIIPDELMPLLDNGERVEKISNQSTCINRENMGQLNEQSVSFTSMRIIDFIKKGLESGLTYCEAFNIWYEFVHMIDMEQAEYALTYIDRNNEDECKSFIDSVLEDDGIVLSTQPFTTPVNIDTIRQIYDKFPWIEPYQVMMPIQNSNGDIRYVKARRPLIVGKVYNYRLKQYAEEKFSVTSLSATNLKNLNTRSKANKVYETKYTKTPIMFGFMESCDMAHLGMVYVVMNLMLYSNSPQARRLFEQLLIGDPFDIDIRLDEYSKNRNAEIINSSFKTMGIMFVFEKILKNIPYVYKNIIYKTIPNKLWTPKTNLLELLNDPKDDLAYHYATAMQHKDQNAKRIYTIYINKLLGPDGKPRSYTNIKDIFEKFEKGEITV